MATSKVAGKPDAGTLGRLAGSLRMRLLFAMPLLLLAACGEKDEGNRGLSANIVDEQPSYDVSNEMPAQDERLAPDNGTESTSANNADVPKPSAATTIPAALQGNWTGLNDRCGDRSAELELKVTPESLVFHESVGTVEGVTTGADGRVRVDAAFTGEGQSWTKRLDLRPSANGRELVITNDGAAVTRKRC
ncbi:hypothetical protein [Sphingobium sp. MI1205]|uniref:hypothetical protein n=1 Tax=Sphingobium sp. MI1205 TaxID=407020 RepID=UPI000781EF86|nr:hypothetical protein [Sphingobium sp. MI1205]